VRPPSDCCEEKLEKRSKCTVNKNSTSLLEFPINTVLKLPFRRKNVQWHVMVEITLVGWRLAGSGWLIFAGKPTENVKIKCLTKHMACVFYKFHVCFFLSVLRKIKHTAHMCGGIKTLKHNLRTTFQLACHGRKNIAHTSKTRQVKWSKWLQLLGSRSACLLLFQTPENRA